MVELGEKGVSKIGVIEETVQIGAQDVSAYSAIEVANLTVPSSGDLKGWRHVTYGLPHVNLVSCDLQPLRPL